MDDSKFTLEKRPVLGRNGRRINIRTNFFAVTLLPEANISHFDVTITPDVPPKLNRKVLEQFAIDNRDGPLGGARPVYDGM